MFVRCLLIAAVAASALLASEPSLIRVGENWRYLPGTSEPSAITNAWTQPGFDDSKWLTGASGFSTSAGSEATPIPEMPRNFLSVYFRKTFVLDQPEQVKWLALRIDYTDGFVAFLNGHEIARTNLAGPPGNFVPFHTTATNWHWHGQGDEIDISAAVPRLITGTNVLAIQAHNGALADFDFALVPELRANFTRGPFVQNASATSIQVIWKTLFPTDTQVEYGIDPSLGNSLSDSTLATTHAVTLTNLASDTLYYYRVRSAVNGQTAVSPVEWFRTHKVAGPLSFVVLSDSGTGSLAQYAIADVIRKARPDLVIHAGDIIYPSFIAGYADTRCLSVYGPHMKNVPYYFAFGNHDLYSGPGAFLDSFYLPTNNVSSSAHLASGTSPEHYYSFDHGDAHFAVLFVPYLNQYHLKTDDPQHRWLAADLAATKKPWKFLVFHHPMCTSSAHRFDDFNGNKILDRIDVMDALLPLADRFGVQLILAGHDHVFERFNPTAGVHNIVTGGGGAGLYPLTELDTGSAQFWSRHHCVKVTVADEELRLEALDRNGDIFDWMTIDRSPASSQSYRSAWNSPVVETQAADDNDGNIYGQRFDFIGAPIPTLPGRFSNLGRVFVNNDRTNLYIGFAQSMIYPDNDIFLFVESPRQSGVTNLLVIGNGKADPTGEGADGLDFLGNLSFTNFTPSVGCILGDEFGDAQLRNFQRGRLLLNSGQGVFQLDATIRDVVGARLQQFNRSPQLEWIPREQNANFIEVALPYTALGGLQPGDVIKLGAVVGGAEFDLNPARQARQLDSSFLGIRLSGSGIGPVVLEGVEVRLALEPGSDPDADGVLTAEELRLGTDPSKFDTDGDGLPDGWELAHQFGPRSDAGVDGADGDPDRDGFSNVAEYTAGTDPRDRESVLTVSAQFSGNQRIQISWSAVVGKRYQIQTSLVPIGGFADLVHPELPIRADSASPSFELDLGKPQFSSRFYRVRVAP